MLLARGDITRRERVLWGVRADEVGPWLEHAQREELFREAVLAFLGVGRAEAAPPPAQPRQDVGTACGGRRVGECALVFGTGLALACSSCGTDYERRGGR
ncbi:hypothetical protein GGQ74_000076 [Desulfobaculum xiamenense]|uniref:Uncharacterized protein n=1 Tax=Desulfobaculum xiamenense TaxID=995050 RepID=A0A846QCJ6_9BACT|nr:hypothetical protein [Desulfobaculum xiamenense]NJB66436.1 hypothetical protein [Desulfobaculum xiamenense]